MVRFEEASVKVKDQFLIQNITGEVQAGETIAIIGPSGAGKSTLLSLCNLLLTPTEGNVYIRGEEVRRWDVQKLRQTVGMVFQSATMFPGTVRDNLEYGLKLRGLASLDQPERLLEDVGLEPSLLAKSADDLSGGQKQRVALGRTLAVDADVLLLDEITSALDVHARAEVESTVVALNQKRKTTMLWVTHDLRQAARVADKVWFMQAGRLFEATDAAIFFRGPKTAEANVFLSQMGERDGE